MKNFSSDNYKMPLALALILHLALAIFLLLQFTFHQDRAESNAIINAAVVAPPMAPSSQPQQLQQPQSEVKADALPLQESLAKNEQAILHRKAKNLPMQQKPVVEQKLTEQKSEREDEKKLAEQKSEQEAKQKLIDKKRLQEQEAKKRQALVEKLANAEQKLLQQQLAHESQALTSLNNERQQQNELTKYIAIVEEAISRNWIVPDSVGTKLVCQLLISVGPRGIVLNVKILKTSGDEALDRSAIAAVYKTSPLPVPADANLFDKFRELRLTVYPSSNN